MLLALDNTDGLQGGCTTQVAMAILDALPELVLRGPPRLVRLNPNVPWKTRGNGAVMLDLGEQRGESAQVGFTSRGPLFVYSDAKPTQPTTELLERAWAVIAAHAQPDAQPGLLLAAKAPAEEWYWNAVRTFVPPEDAVRAVSETLHRATGDGRGLVGCLAAAAWRGPASSHELLGYRPPQEWGSPRRVAAAPLAGLDEAGVTFHTTWGNRLLCVPRGPDPVLMGLRGRDRERLLSHGLPALLAAGGNSVASWAVWETNQASGDHVTAAASIADPLTLATMQVEATVATRPETRRGGHVFVAMLDAGGHEFLAAAFQPTASFRDLVRALRVGDEVTLVGALRDGALALEKFAVRRLAKIEVKVANPVCCGKSAKSRGRGKGFRCTICGTVWPPDTATFKVEPRRLRPGWYEVPPNARRHLHRPLAFDQPGVTDRSSKSAVVPTSRKNNPTAPTWEASVGKA